MAVLFAFSLQDQVEKYGAYVGLAAFLGLAVLTVLYFAQAREVKRLRDWAGRAPERAQEREARVVAQADELRRPPAERSGTVSPARPVPQPGTAAGAPSGNGRGTGTPAPIPPGPRPAVAVAAAAAQARAAAGADEDVQTQSAATADAPPTEVAAVPADESPAEASEPTAPAASEAPARSDEAAGNGDGAGATPSPIPRATPRPQARPAPAAPLRTSGARTATVPPRRAGALRDAGSSRTARITLYTLGGVVAAALVVFGAIQLLGGDGEPRRSTPNVTESPAASPSGDTTPSAAEQRPDTVVVVLNGTATDGLASSLAGKLVAQGYSDQDGMIRTGNNTDQQRQDSAVLYARGMRRMARDVAQILGIATPPEPVDADTLALANNTGSSAAGHETDVVVVAGADQAP